YFRLRRLDPDAALCASRDGVSDPDGLSELSEWYVGLKSLGLFSATLYASSLSTLHQPRDEPRLAALVGPDGVIHGRPDTAPDGMTFGPLDYVTIPNPSGSPLETFSIFASFEASPGRVGLVFGSPVPHQGPGLYVGGSPQQGLFPSELFMDYSPDGSTSPLDYGLPGRRTFHNGHATGRPQTALVNFSPADLLIRSDLDIPFERTLPHAAAWNGNPQWMIGNIDGGVLSIGGKIHFVALFARPITEQEHLRLRSLLASTLGRRVRYPEVNLIVEGDSYSADGFPSETCWTTRLLQEPNWKGRFTMRNVATGGEFILQMVDEFDSEVRPYASVGQRDYLCLWGGSNDLASTPGIALLDNLKTYWAKARSSGLRVVAFTLLSRRGLSPEREARRQALNDQIRAASNLYDYLIDVAAIPELQDPENMTYRMNDGVHLRTAGMQLVADAVNAAIPAP
ncbi:MAG TPA: hypothetical protein DCM86_15660, partial [Verrucomicrobiales bacterium]|nr:hypothetical protein [Verrucomicrobiales bacterium]